MSDRITPQISSQTALAVLQKAKAKGNLPKDVSEGIVDLALLGVRPDIEDALVSEDPDTLDEQYGEDPEARILNSIQKNILYEATKKCFAELPEHYERLEGVTFEEFWAALEASHEDMWRYYWMFETDGQPDVVADLGGSYLVRDCSKETPEPRRGWTYYQARFEYEYRGLQVLKEDGWNEMQEMGSFDTVMPIVLNSEDILHNRLARMMHPRHGPQEYPARIADLRFGTRAEFELLKAPSFPDAA